MTTEFDPKKQVDSETLGDIEAYLKLPITEKKRDWKECEHFRVSLDNENKTVTCQDCKKVLDAFWYLQLLAKEWSFRRYQDYEAVKAYRSFQQQEKNAQARGKCFVRPQQGDGMLCWDSYEALYGHAPEYVFYRGAWYAGEDGSSEIFELIQAQLAAGADKYRLQMNEYLKQFIEINKISHYVAKHIYDIGFNNGRNYGKAQSG